MAEAVVSMVVERLGTLLIEEAKLIHGVGDQVRDVRDELWWMQCFLRDVDARQHKDLRLRTWVREIKEIAYDAGDVLESFILQVESRRGGSILNVLKRYTCLVNGGVIRHEVGSRIQAIETRISKLTTRLQTYGVKSLPEDRESLSFLNQRQSEWRRAYSHVAQDDFVGLEEDVENLVDKLLNDDQDGDNYYQAVAICGMGGLGKTTLARKIYHHEKVKGHFDAHAWVCISQQWQLTTILQQILVKLIPGDKDEINKTRDNGQLKRQICDEQQKKNCLIVLDDIWYEDSWNSLKDAFPMNTLKSKLLLTTRNIKVAEQVNPNVFVHKPRTLNEDECLKLLKKKALFTMQDGPDTSKKEELATIMIKECGGLPLAVIVLGGILATKQSLSEWERVNQSIKSYIIRGDGMGQQEGDVSKILGLSYNDLPYQLKPCFLYLGKFQEDSKIKAERLYQLWMAENMILSEDQRKGETMMNVAERYLNELAQRSMVEVQLEEDKERFREFRTCSLHDLMRDFCLSKAKEEDFFNIVHFQHENSLELSESSSSFTNKTRRVVIYFEDEETTNGKFSLDKETSQRLRSLLFFAAEGKEYYCGAPSVVRSHLSDFKMLKVLAIEGFCPTYPKSGIIKLANFNCDGLALLKAISKLIHLRYLSLKDSEFFIFPSSINNLQHLQTLDLRGYFRTFDLRGYFHFFLECSRNMLRKMRQLQHLYLPNNYDGNMTTIFKSSKLQLDSLSNLETLENYDTSWCDGKGLSKLVNLRKLKAWLNGLEEVEQIIDYLSCTAAKHMRYSYLSIHGDLDFDSEKGHTILIKILSCDHLHRLGITTGICKKLPGCDEVLNFSQSLAMLKLCGLSLKEDPMPTLEKLPNLKSLFLDTAFEGKTMVCCDKGFPRLKSLKLIGLESFENWHVENGAMPKLSQLEFWYCKSLKTVPDGLSFITTMTELVIKDMDEEFIREVQDGKGEDFDRIRRVARFL
ncbi:hypothetical protein LguiA_030601 [Lonicera macranthoides]